MNAYKLARAAMIAALVVPSAAFAGLTLPSDFLSSGTTTTTTTTGTTDTTGTTTLDTATMDACKAAPSICDITLSDVVGDVLFGETEPNNYRYSADPITVDIPINGQLYGATDEDWYIFQTTAINQNVSIGLAESTEGSWNISLRDKAGNILASADSVVGTSFTLEATVAQSGNQYIVITPTVDGGYSSEMYKLSLHIESTDLADAQDPFNFFDVELETNGLFTTANPIVTGVKMEGQFMNGSDLDVYRIDSTGNEILTLELCGEADSCNGGGAWALALLDGRSVSNSMITTARTVAVYDKSIDDLENAGSVSFTSSHPYYLMETGAFSSAMIGLIDPTWGSSTVLNVGLRDAGTYYVMVMPVLKRDSDGSILLKTEESKKPDTITIVVEPFSDDQYTLRATRTSLTPSIEDSL